MSQTRRCKIFVTCSLEPMAVTGSTPQRPKRYFPPLSLAMGTRISGASMVRCRQRFPQQVLQHHHVQHRRHTRRPCIFDHPDDLRLGKTALSHASALSRLGRLYVRLRAFPGAGTNAGRPPGLGGRCRPGTRLGCRFLDKAQPVRWAGEDHSITKNSADRYPPPAANPSAP